MERSRKCILIVGAQILLAVSAAGAATDTAKGAAPAEAQRPTGTLRGTVVLEATGGAVQKATVMVVQLGRSTESGEDGTFEFRDIPAGSYEVVAHMAALTDARKTVAVPAGGVAEVDFALRISPVREQVIVTASGREQTGFETFQAVTTLDLVRLVETAGGSLGEALERESGVAKRSFGPGSSRPVIRGFDGDRVLVLADGVRTGSLSSQSGDHGEAISTLGLERVEVVKGPATLLYGSNAIGGVVNTISRHHEIHQHPHPGFSGFLTGIGGSANATGGGGAGIELGHGPWLLWKEGTGHRSGDYRTPLGRVENSRSELAGAQAGLARFGRRGFFSFGYRMEYARYGIPFAGELHEHDHDAEDDRTYGLFGARSAFGLAGAEAQGNGEEHEEVLVDFRSVRHNARFSAGYREAPHFLENFRLTLDFSNYRHQEIETEQGVESIGTTFDNRQFVYRGVFEQRRGERLSGSFGFWGMWRDYDVTGEEALAPPVRQNAIAAFLLQEVAAGRGVRFQFGGRVEHNRYRVRQGSLPDRSFTGFSGAAGIHVPVWEGGAFVANYTHAHRAPALEELYNFGPHIGNLAFEIGNSDLASERSNGVDVSLRHRDRRIRFEGNLFAYRVGNFVFLAPTGEIEDGLMEAEFLQGNSRFLGGEVNFDLQLARSLWLLAGMDAVDAQLTRAVTSSATGVTTASGTPLPRIPPVRGRIGVEARFGGLSVRPEVVIAGAQESLFHGETRTPGYAVVNLRGSYTIAQAHLLHVFSVNAFNLGDRLYRNHLSFIKDRAPEIGRGVRFVYTARFF